MNVAAPSTDVSYYTNQLGTGAIIAIVVLSAVVWAPRQALLLVRA
mgnify:CR=1 FL=1